MLTFIYLYFYTLIILISFKTANTAATQVNYVCSAYCNSNDCSVGFSKSTTDCGGISNCRSQFIVIGTNC